MWQTVGDMPIRILGALSIPYILVLIPVAMGVNALIARFTKISEDTRVEILCIAGFLAFIAPGIFLTSGNEQEHTVTTQIRAVEKTSPINGGTGQVLFEGDSKAYPIMEESTLNLEPEAALVCAYDACIATTVDEAQSSTAAEAVLTEARIWYTSVMTSPVNSSNR